MKPETAKIINELNTQFYQVNATGFALTRNQAKKGWQSVLKRVPLHRPLQVLDVACGNGLFGVFLAENKVECMYTGIDNSEGLLQSAKQRIPRYLQPRFIKADISDPAWVASLHQKRFDLVVCFAALHHLPGFELRLRLLQELLEATNPEGMVAISTWDFYPHERFKKKIVSWNAFKQTETGKNLDTTDLEEHDYLMSWQNSKTPRYVHWVNEEEARQLAKGLGAEINVEMFLADGDDETFNRYLLLNKNHTA
jgi:tRNA (uracil-5-)-methyltransferase TRM9